MLVKDEMGMLEDLKEEVEEVEEVEEECYEAAAIQMPTISRKRSSMGKHQFADICVNANVMWKFSVRCGGDGCPRSEVHVSVSGCLWVGGCWGGGGRGVGWGCVCSCLRACVYVMPMFHAIWKPRAVCRVHVVAVQSARPLHARVCFGEITSKKTERIVMIL